MKVLYQSCKFKAKLLSLDIEAFTAWAIKTGGLICLGFATNQAVLDMKFDLG